MNAIKRYAADNAHVIFGTAYDESLGDHLRVTVIATGLNSARKAVAQPGMGLHGAQAHAPQHHSYEGLSTPSVRRSARSQAAAKFDSLSGNGMDEIEIPAFLRKQAD